MGEIIEILIPFIISLFAFILSIRSFREKGFLLNNAYIYASKKERADMYKKPYYRQTAVIFFLIGIIFLLLGFAILLNISRITYIAYAVILITLIYAVISDIVIRKRKNIR